MCRLSLRLLYTYTSILNYIFHFQCQLIGLLHHRDDIAFQVIACLNVLLYPGNDEAQQKISSLVTHYNSGLFVRVHQILHSAQSSLTHAK